MTPLIHTILHYLRLCWNFITSFFVDHGGSGIRLTSFFHRSKGQGRLLTFDNGLQVEMGKQIAEGGFSYVFEAFPLTNTRSGAASVVGERNSRRVLSSKRSSSTLTSADTDDPHSRHHVKYALKRINCADHEIVQSCRHEAGIHRSLPSQHPNLLELLGLKFDNDTISSSSSTSLGSTSSSSGSAASHKEYNVCYMLFPYIPYSLRGETTNRNLLYDPSDPSASSVGGRYQMSRRPFATKEILQLFGGLIDALTAMHNANLSHRDVKLENVLLQSSGYGDARGRGRKNSTTSMYTPILMDFGSAGPLQAQVTSRREVLTIVENAASHTTMPYRPPELFEGGIRHGPREVLDYGKVDVWSLGCVLFGLMHGTSPFEMEFMRSQQQQMQGQQQYGLIRIVECTHLKILGEVPFPPWAGGGALGNGIENDNIDNGQRGTNGKYPMLLYKLIRCMIHHDRMKRPNIHEVAKRFGELYLELMGGIWISYEEGGSSHGEAGKGGTNYDDFDALIAGRDFV